MIINFDISHTLNIDLQCKNDEWEIINHMGWVTLDDAKFQAQELIKNYAFDCIDAIDATTGELIFEAYPTYEDEYEEDEFDDPADDWFNDFGFNPYTGGYDYDC